MPRTTEAVAICSQVFRERGEGAGDRRGGERGRVSLSPLHGSLFSKGKKGLRGVVSERDGENVYQQAYRKLIATCLECSRGT